jgi:DNA-binding winged helix-turn-helix (wHTH) protein
MADEPSSRRYRFGVFEADATTGELRRQGIRVKLNSQPFQLLLMLLERPGEVLSREEISAALWPSDTFVDYDHGMNSAVNRIREALGDSAGNPRFVETLARRGYRFVAPVQRIADAPDPFTALKGVDAQESAATQTQRSAVLASPEELPDAPHHIVRTLFLALQLMYLGFYVGVLANLAEVQDLLSALPRAGIVYYFIIGTAAILIPVRVFVVCAVLFRPPRFPEKFLKMWPYLLFADVVWALSPLLLLRHINMGLAIACMALLVYSPFAQRSLVLMGAGGEQN